MSRLLAWGRLTQRRKSSDLGISLIMSGINESQKSAVLIEIPLTSLGTTVSLLNTFHRSAWSHILKASVSGRFTQLRSMFFDALCTCTLVKRSKMSSSRVVCSSRANPNATAAAAQPENGLVFYPLPKIPTRPLLSFLSVIPNALIAVSVRSYPIFLSWPPCRLLWPA